MSRRDLFRAGDRTELLTFEMQRFTENAEGQRTGRWFYAFQEWADADRTSETNATFRTDYLERLTRITSEDDPAQKIYRILFEGAYWQITSVVHDRSRRWTSIECDFSMMVEVTNLDSDAQREFIVGLPVVHP